MVRTTRRSVLTAAFASMPMSVLGEPIQPAGIAMAMNAQATQSTPPATEAVSTTGVIGQADMPRWSFTVVDIQDPFVDKLTFPQKLPPDTRAVQSQIVITNDADQPLDFKTSDIHLLDVEGVEYPAGNATGSQPKLVSQTLPNGERTRGWVWFLVRSGVKIQEIKFYAPAPQLRVPVENKKG